MSRFESLGHRFFLPASERERDILSEVSCFLLISDKVHIEALC